MAKRLLSRGAVLDGAPEGASMACRVHHRIDLLVIHSPARMLPLDCCVGPAQFSGNAPVLMEHRLAFPHAPDRRSDQDIAGRRSRRKTPVDKVRGGA